MYAPKQTVTLPSMDQELSRGISRQQQRPAFQGLDFIVVLLQLQAHQRLPGVVLQTDPLLIPQRDLIQCM